MTRGAALTGALLATLALPATWPLALGAFLVRGGILLFILPVLVLPSPVGVANVVSPLVVGVAFGTISPNLLVGPAVVIVALAVVLLLGGWLAAALEAEGTRLVAADEDVRGLAHPVDPSAIEPPTPRAASERGRAGVAVRILAVRLVAAVPFAVAIGVGAVRLISVTYRELTLPGDLATPILLRVLIATPDVVIALILTWMAAEIVGAVAARRIVLAGDSTSVALGASIRITVRHPLRTLARFWLPTLALVVVVVPSIAAASAAWGAVRGRLAQADDPLATILAVVVFVTLWLVGVALAGVVSAWRSAVWTTAQVVEEGTFGASEHSRPGDWRNDPSSATL